MKEEKWEILCKDVIIVYDASQIVTYDTTTNVKEIKNYAVVTRGKEIPQERKRPQVHDIAVLFLNKKPCTEEVYQEVLEKIKEQYGDNLLCLLDELGNSL